MKKIYVTKKEVVGITANYIVRQSPYIPENLTEILNYVNDFTQDYQPQNRDVLVINDNNDLKTFIRLMVFGSPKITDLNMSQAEKKGKQVPKHTFVSKYDYPKKEYDFVDLDALCMNICRDIEFSYERNKI